MGEGVQLYDSPWVSGTRAVAYFGPILCELFVEDGVDDRTEAWEKAEGQLLEALRDKAQALGANAVVGFEVTLDPFAKSKTGAAGLSLQAVGTAAKLEPLF